MEYFYRGQFAASLGQSLVFLVPWVRGIFVCYSMSYKWLMKGAYRLAKLAAIF